ncbi:MAG: hypothetical protein QOE92_2004 [Chloroflexota bacterium]|nr:hypothetical protein [Chloroflexota bacterium]
MGLVFPLLAAMFAGSAAIPHVDQLYAAVARVGHQPAPLQAHGVAPVVRFTTPHSSVAAAPGVATLEIPGPAGAFAVPYVQTSSDLDFDVEHNGPADRSVVDVVLDQGTPAARSLRLAAPPWHGTFHDLAYGEHTLDARLFTPGTGTLDSMLVGRAPVALTRLEHVGRGDIVAALGDSISEGRTSGPFPQGAVARLGYFPDWVSARSALDPVAADWVSADGRNYPQASQNDPSISRPGFEVDLGRRLAAERGHPVMVLNLGWSGITADGFAHVVESDYFRSIVAATRPNAWLVDLGVNDVLVHRPADEYGARLRAVIDGLGRLGATGDRIHVACPSYRSGATEDAEKTYMPVVNDIRTGMRLAPGPDFFSTYRDHAELRSDWVHPSSAGYAVMADQWGAALAGQGVACPQES